MRLFQPRACRRAAFGVGAAAALRARGFTLVELMVVVAIVAILAALAFPSYSNYVLRSKLRVAQADLVALAANAENHRQRTLWYPEAGPDADPAAVFSGWQPAADEDALAFAITSSASAYSATATWQQGGKLEGCVLTIASTAPQRQASDACSRVGSVDW